MLARACLWAQETDDALTYAQEIIDLVTAKTLKFSTSSSILSTPKMFDDLLFGFYHEKLVATFEPYAEQHELEASHHRRQDLLHHADERLPEEFSQYVDQLHEKIHRQRHR